MIKITKGLLDDILKEAEKNPRNRYHYNFHKSYKELIQRLLNACNKDTYFRPHCHIDSGKIEILLVMRGSLLVVLFDDEGNITDYHFMNTENGVDGVELQPDEWHSIIILEDNTIMYEIKEGPYDEGKAKIFASWAPAEENSKEAKSFNERILRMINE